MSALDIPPPPAPWEGRRVVQLARQADAAALRSTLRPPRPAWRSALIALPMVVLVVLMLAAVFGPLLASATLALVAAR